MAYDFNRRRSGCSATRGWDGPADGESPRPRVCRAAGAGARRPGWGGFSRGVWQAQQGAHDQVDRLRASQRQAPTKPATLLEAASHASTVGPARKDICQGRHQAKRPHGPAVYAPQHAPRHAPTRATRKHTRRPSPDHRGRCPPAPAGIRGSRRARAARPRAPPRPRGPADSRPARRTARPGRRARALTPARPPRGRRRRRPPPGRRPARARRPRRPRRRTLPRRARRAAPAAASAATRRRRPPGPHPAAAPAGRRARPRERRPGPRPCLRARARQAGGAHELLARPLARRGRSALRPRPRPCRPRRLRGRRQRCPPGARPALWRAWCACAPPPTGARPALQHTLKARPDWPEPHDLHSMPRMKKHTSMSGTLLLRLARRDAQWSSTGGAPCLREAQPAAGRLAERAEQRACSRLHRCAAWFLGAPARLAASFAAAFWPDEPSARVAALRCTLCAARPQRPAWRLLGAEGTGGHAVLCSAVLGKTLRRCWAPTPTVGIVPARPSRVQSGRCLPGAAPRAAGALCHWQDGRQA